MIYRNDNVIFNDDKITGTITDLIEYFKYEIASQCMSVKEIENLTDILRETASLLDNLEESKQLYNNTDLLTVSVHPMNGFIITKED